VFNIEVLRNYSQQLTCLARPEPRHELQKKNFTVSALAMYHKKSLNRVF
jgi:hypothetical protein